MRLLVVEDDRTLARVLSVGLREEGYSVDVSMDGDDAARRATTIDYDAMILDVALPGKDGLEVLGAARAAGRTGPAIFLTARDAVADRVLGLDTGADDYLVKPFEWDELLARIRALVRRGRSSGPGVLEHGELRLDPASRLVTRRGEEIVLTAKEFALLWMLIERPGSVVTRSEINDHLYDDAFEGMSNVIEALVSRLRKKLANRDGALPLISTIRGVGYVLEEVGHA